MVRFIKKGTPEEIFASPEALMQMGLDVPDVIRFQKQFEEKFHTKLKSDMSNN